MQIKSMLYDNVSDNTQSILKVENLKVFFGITKGIAKKRVGVVKAVDDVSFEVQKGKTIGIVGESGCGKTTTGKAILGMVSASEGKVFFHGRGILSLGRKEHNEIKRKLQMIFQDPYGSLDPRQSAFSIIKEVLVADGVKRTKEQIKEEVNSLLSMVGLPEDMGGRFPHELSGGQRQRIGIARALACRPEIIICDEPVSALDVSIQAQIINLLQGLQQSLGLTYIFVAHDLAVVKHIADQVCIMYLGSIVETMDSDEMFSKPLHPYTKALISAIPVVDYHLERTRKRMELEGEIPSPINRPMGCPFNPRCPHATEQCKKETPQLEVAYGNHMVSCFNYKELMKQH